MTPFRVECPNCQCQFPVDSETMRVIKGPYSFPNPAFEQAVTADIRFHESWDEPEPAA